MADKRASLKDQPLVSVIVPTYKRADMIQRAVDSILDQTYKNIEVIVVNDNDKDSPEYTSTDELLEDELKDGRVCIVHTSGSTGGGNARNYGVTFAKGEYLTFLDDDDIFLPAKVEKQLDFMRQHNYDMTYQDVSWYDAKTGKLVEHRKLDHVKDFSRKGLLRAHMITPISPTAIYMMKTSLFRKTLGFGDVLVGQDWFLMLRCIEADANIGYMPGVYVHQFLHSGERLSLGNNKIIGENELYNVRRSYFPILSPKERRYVNFRHYAVLAFAYKRRHHWIEALRYVFQAFTASPISFLKEIPKYFGSAKK